MHPITDHLPGWLGAALLLSMALVVGLSPVPHLHDFGEWLFQGVVLAMKVIEPDAVSRFVLAPYPVPNSLAPYALALLGLFLEPVPAGKLFLVLLLLGWLPVLRAFVRRHVAPDQRGWVFALLAAVAALASFFWYGFVGYQLGLLLFFAFLARFTTGRSAAWLALFGIAIFLAHAMVFMAWGLLMLLWALDTRAVRARVALALLPAALLTLAYLVGQRLAGVAPQFVAARIEDLGEALLFKLGSPLMLGGFRNLILPDGGSLLEGLPGLYWTGAAGNAVTVAVLGVFVLRVFLARPRPAEDGAGPGAPSSGLPATVLRRFGLVVIAAYLLAPYNLGGLIHPGGRLLLPLLAVALMLAPPRLLTLIPWAALPALAGAVISVASYGIALHRVGPSPVTIERKAPGEAPRHSVFAFNAWMHGNTRYKYFNYRVFAFAERYRQLDEGRLTRLNFHTGPIIDYAENPGADPGPVRPAPSRP